MSTIQVFDAPLCCSSGVCGNEVDQKRVTFAADFSWAKEQGVAVEHFNLAQQPLAYVENAVVKTFLDGSGVEGLPLILVDGEIALAGRYPQRRELTLWAGLPHPQPELAGNCCSGGKCCG